MSSSGKRKKFLLLIAILAAGGLLTARGIAANAFPLLALLNGRSTSGAAMPSPVPTAVLVRNTPTAPAAVSLPSPTAAATPTATPVQHKVISGPDAVIALLETLQAKRGMFYSQDGAGWWHMVRKVGGPDTGQTFADGSPVPASWITESWFFVGEDGYITQMVDIQDTGSPATSQVSIYNNGQLRGLNDGEAETVAPSFAPKNVYISIDELQQFFQQYSQDGDYVQVEKGFWENTDAYVLSWFTTFPPGGKMLGAPENAIGTLYKAYYSIQNGDELAYEMYTQLDDGSLLLEYRDAEVLLERIDEPPTNVQQYLQ